MNIIWLKIGIPLERVIGNIPWAGGPTIPGTQQIYGHLKDTQIYGETHGCPTDLNMNTKPSVNQAANIIFELL